MPSLATPTRRLLGLVLLIGCAHGLVHVYELSLPCVEQLIAAEFHPGDPVAGKRLSGGMANWWRLPFGLGALLAGGLVDRFGGRPLLVVYLLGCGAMSMLAWLPLPLDSLYAVMIAMGGFAAIYHPAGLSLLSHEIPPEQLPKALGLHGICGSLGIGGAPLAAGLVLSLTNPPQWRSYYLVLSAAGFVLGAVFLFPFLERRLVRRSTGAADQPRKSPIDSAALSKQSLQGAVDPASLAPAEQADWFGFYAVCVFGSLMGFCYAAFVAFLPRFLDGTGADLGGYTREAVRNYLAGGVLLVGCAGQYLGGSLARTKRLEWQLAVAAAGDLPGLLLMIYGRGWQQIVGAACFSLVHFSQQPLYNSLIAKYTPKSRRSLCYGLSFTLSFGLGSFGARFAGYSSSNQLTYGVLAAVTTLGALIGLMLWRRRC